MVLAVAASVGLPTPVDPGVRSHLPAVGCLQPYGPAPIPVPVYALYLAPGCCYVAPVGFPRCWPITTPPRWLVDLVGWQLLQLLRLQRTLYVI